MKWFKTLWLTSEEREILNRAKQKPVEAPAPDVDTNLYVEIAGKPYKNLYYSNQNLTVVFKDGTVLSKSHVSTEEFQKVRDAITAAEIERLLTDTLAYAEPVVSKSTVETKEDRELVSKNLAIIKDHPEFEVKGQDVYLKGVNLAMPASVISSFIEILEKDDEYYLNDADAECWDELDEQFEALKMFWLKLALNTLPQSREDLLNFIRLNDVKITRNGNLILYRRIVSKDGADKELVTFVTQEYYKLKKAGYDTRQYAIAKVGDGYILVDLNEFDPSIDLDVKPFCNLQQMYLELPTYDTNTFTAAHDGSVDIRLGGIYKIPDKSINLNNGICAAGGLHAACVNYNYSGFGDMPVVVLVNPSKAITVPVGDTGKLRTTEMFIACVNDKEQGVHFDESALSAFDSEYHDATLEELEEAAKSKSFEKLSVQDTVPAVSLVDLNVIKEMLKRRVQTI